MLSSQRPRWRRQICRSRHHQARIGQICARVECVAAAQEVGAMTPGLSPGEVAALRYFSDGSTLRSTLRYIDDAAPTIGLWTAEMQLALNSLVAAGLLVAQELLDEEPDALTGRRGKAFRIT